MLPCSAMLLASLLVPASQGPHGVTVVQLPWDADLTAAKAIGQ